VNSFEQDLLPFRLYILSLDDLPRRCTFIMPFPHLMPSTKPCIKLNRGNRFSPRPPPMFPLFSSFETISSRFLLHYLSSPSTPGHFGFLFPSPFSLPPTPLVPCRSSPPTVAHRLLSQSRGFLVTSHLLGHQACFDTLTPPTFHISHPSPFYLPRTRSGAEWICTTSSYFPHPP